MSDKKEIQNAYEFYKGAGANALLETTKLMQKIACNCSSEEFEKFAKTKEMPPIKLSESDLALVKGGGLPAWLDGYGTCGVFYGFSLEGLLPPGGDEPKSQEVTGSAGARG